MKAGEPESGGLLTDRVSLGVLAETFPKELLDEVLAATGRGERRVRLLPAHVVMRYVMALCLFFGDGYEEVMRKLVQGLRSAASWDRAWKVPSTSALAQARQRLGAEPLRELFERACVPQARRGTRGAWLREWRLMAIDATSFDVPDTEANTAVFHRSGSGPKASAFPKAHLAALMECGTRAYVAARIGSVKDGERTLTASLTGAMEPGMLVIADASLYGWELWNAARSRGADLAWRIGASVTLPLVSPLADGSYLALLYAPRLQARRRVKLLARARAGEEVDSELAELVRVVEYTVPDRNPDGELIVVATTITDPARLPADEVAFAYHQRWEEETGFDEIKTHQRGGGAVLRSKSPQMIEQEIWAMLLTHYAVRAQMTRAADHAGIDPDRLSFTRALNIVRRQVTDQAAFSP